MFSIIKFTLLNFIKSSSSYFRRSKINDIKKISFRLWVYGTISIFEILLLDILRLQNHNENTLTELLPKSRIEYAKKYSN